MIAPARSGIPWIDALFDACVWILFVAARFFGTSYNTINIWIFCIIWPLVTLALIGIVIFQFRKLRRLGRRIEELEFLERRGI